MTNQPLSELLGMCRESDQQPHQPSKDATPKGDGFGWGDAARYDPSDLEIESDPNE